MAYAYVNKLKHLRLSVAGSYVYLSNVKSPTIRPSEFSTILGSTSFSQLLYSARNTTNPDLFAELVAYGYGGAGDIDLYTYHDILTDGQQLRIFNPDIGTSYYIQLTRNVSGSSTPNFGGYVKQPVGNSTLGTYVLRAQDSSVEWRKASIGFIFDKDAGIGYYIVVRSEVIVSATYKTCYRYIYCATTSGNTTLQNNMKLTCGVILSNNEPEPEPTPSTDPYADGGTSTTGGGGGDFDDSSDTINLPSIPALNLTISKMLNAYHISVTDLNDLADWIWGNYDKTDASKVLSKIFADPTDAIVALFMLPFTPGYSSAIPVTVGGYAAGSLEFSPLSQQFYDVDCGSLTISEYWGNYLDYNPYTRLTMFLPGVGEVQLDPDEVMGKTISVKYRVDCLTGQFVCFVYGDNKIFSQYQGNCALQVPVSSADYSRLNSSMLQAATMAAGVAVGVATGGGMAALAEGADALPSTALNLLNSKVNHSHSGSLGGASFFIGSQKPYVIIHRARQSVPEYANTFYGYPSNVTAVLGSLTGFTSVKNIVLDDLPLTKAELDSLRDILAAGFYI